MNSEKEVERYEFEKPNPIKGYPELYWRGKRPFTSTQYYPAQLKERYGEEDENGWINKIFWGDNLQVMSHMLKEYRGKIDLIYIDPPFASDVDYKKKIKLKCKEINSDMSSFEEKQYTDIWVNDEYLQFMYERIIIIRELLSETGSFILHCDWHKSQYLRCICDEVFGMSNFRNEISWCYGGGGAPKTQYPCKHDNLLWYTKTDKWTFNKQFRPYSQGTLERGLTEVKGESYELNKDGAMLNDWWAEKEVQKILSPTAYENLKYPTQKPEGLLKRIILGHTNKGDIVLDCFMGSGTTMSVAHKLGRKFIGADINLSAVQITIKRLIETIKNSNNSELSNCVELYTVNNYDIFRNPVEAKELLSEALGVQKLDKSYIYDGELDGRMVKIMPVNRIATRVDLGELITGLPYKEFEKRERKHPNLPVEKITLVCMGHEADLKAYLQSQVDYNIDVEIVDILRDKTELEFKRESEAKIIIDEDLLVIHKFYPRNLLQKMSILDEDIDDWRQLVESVCIDFYYDGAVMEPSITDIPDRDELVKGKYKIPKDAGVIKVKITDVLSETFEWEGAYEYGKEIGIEPVCSV